MTALSPGSWSGLGNRGNMDTRHRPETGAANVYTALTCGDGWRVYTGRGAGGQCSQRPGPECPVCPLVPVYSALPVYKTCRQAFVAKQTRAVLPKSSPLAVATAFLTL